MRKKGVFLPLVALSLILTLLLGGCRDRNSIPQRPSVKIILDFSDSQYEPSGDVTIKLLYRGSRILEMPLEVQRKMASTIILAPIPGEYTLLVISGYDFLPVEAGKFTIFVDDKEKKEVVFKVNLVKTDRLRLSLLYPNWGQLNQEVVVDASLSNANLPCKWRLVNKPQGSSASLEFSGLKASFIPDLPGKYVVSIAGDLYYEEFFIMVPGNVSLLKKGTKVVEAFNNSPQIAYATQDGFLVRENEKGVVKETTFEGSPIALSIAPLDDVLALLTNDRVLIYNLLDLSLKDSFTVMGVDDIMALTDNRLLISYVDGTVDLLEDGSELRQLIDADFRCWVRSADGQQTLAFFKQDALLIDKEIKIIPVSGYFSWTDKPIWFSNDLIKTDMSWFELDKSGLIPKVIKKQVPENIHLKTICSNLVGNSFVGFSILQNNALVKKEFGKNEELLELLMPFSKINDIYFTSYSPDISQSWYLPHYKKVLAIAKSGFYHNETYLLWWDISN